MTEKIFTKRLDLIEMTPQFLAITSDGDNSQANLLLEMEINPEWYQFKNFAAFRLKQFRLGETFCPWLPRAIKLRETGIMVGFIGFHLPPISEVGEGLPQKTVEIGYEMFSEYRRRGLAFESVLAMIEWARNSHAITHVRASISPTNFASIQLIAKMGFVKIGSQIDVIDGEEDISQLSIENTALNQVITPRFQ